MLPTSLLTNDKKAGLYFNITTQIKMQIYKPIRNHAIYRRKHEINETSTEEGSTVQGNCAWISGTLIFGDHFKCIRNKALLKNEQTVSPWSPWFILYIILKVEKALTPMTSQ